jgi:hypothetical protein
VIRGLFLGYSSSARRIVLIHMAIFRSDLAVIDQAPQQHFAPPYGIKALADCLFLVVREHRQEGDEQQILAGGIDPPAGNGGWEASPNFRVSRTVDREAGRSCPLELLLKMVAPLDPRSKERTPLPSSSGEEAPSSSACPC